MKVVIKVTRSTSNGAATTSDIHLKTTSVGLSNGKRREGGNYVDSLFSDTYPIFRRLNMNALESFEMLETAYPIPPFDTTEYLMRVYQFLRDSTLSSITVKYFNSYRKYTLYYYELLITTHFQSGPGSSVGIATELRAGRSGIESRCGREFPPAQTGPGAQPASCKMGNGSFPGLK